MSFHWKTSDGEDRVARAWPRDWGHGVLACVHGLSGSGEQFEPVAHQLDFFSVYALELRGQGLDPVPERRAMVLDLEAQHRDIEPEPGTGGNRGQWEPEEPGNRGQCAYSCISLKIPAR